MKISQKPWVAGAVTGVGTALVTLGALLPNGLTLDEIIIVLLAGLTGSGYASGVAAHGALQDALNAKTKQLAQSAEHPDE